MTSTLSNPLTPDAIQLGDTIVQLQSLVEAYGTVLNQAKQQLEQLELTPEQLRRVEERAHQNINLQRLACTLVNQFDVSSSVGTDQQRAFDALLDTIVRRVTNRIADATLARFRDEIRGLVDTAIEEAQDRFKLQTDSYFNRVQDRQLSNLRADNDEMRRTLRRVLSQAFAPEELNGMAVIAIQEEPTTNEVNA
jgi:uncharacterized protein (DUF2267 family)